MIKGMTVGELKEIETSSLTTTKKVANYSSGARQFFYTVIWDLERFYPGVREKGKQIGTCRDDSSDLNNLWFGLM